jgi:NAD(P)-dependent dehydrogenase (short-subunit alcohol dehydrogenase family)
MRLADVRAVVTGGTSGLGRATAESLLAAGARVVVLGRDGARGEQVVRQGDGRAVFAQADIADPEQVQAALDQGCAALGTPNVLVNCAGVAAFARLLGRDGAPACLDDFTRIIQVNLIGTFNCIRLTAALMARNEPAADGERGVIVSTASIAVYDGQVGQAAYAASKAGVVAMTLPIARELAGLRIRAVTLAPGLFETPMLDPMPERMRASLTAQTVYPKRFGTAEEFAGTVLHVIENPMLNGATIRLDGAMRMGPT